MDMVRARKLIQIDLDDLAAKTSDPRAGLEALGRRVEEEIAAISAFVSRGEAAPEDLDEALERAQATLTKLDGIIAKAKADGRPELATAAEQRRATTRAEIAAIEAQTSGVGADPEEARAVLAQLEEKHADVLTQLEALSMALPDDGGFDLSDLGAEPPEPVRGPPVPASQRADLGAKQEAGDPMEDEFAALMAQYGDDAAAPAPAKASAKDDGDDVLAALPSLVEVGDGELPEGEEADEFDFSAIDAMVAREAGRPVPTPAKAKAKASAKGGAKPPAKADAKAPAAKKAGGDEASKGGGGKVWLWTGLGVTVAGGGTFAVLYALGIIAL